MTIILGFLQKKYFKNLKNYTWENLLMLALFLFFFNVSICSILLLYVYNDNGIRRCLCNHGLWCIIVNLFWLDYLKSNMADYKMNKMVWMVQDGWRKNIFFVINLLCQNWNFKNIISTFDCCFMYKLRYNTYCSTVENAPNCCTVNKNALKLL